MRGLTDHQELAAQLQHARERVLESVVGLTDEEASAPGNDGWSIKDHLAHMTLWHEMRFFEISRIARGGEAGFPSSSEERIQPLNDLFAENRHSLSLGQVIADLEFAWEMVNQAVAMCPEDRLAERHFDELGPTGAGHDIAHAEMITSLRS
jgi:hypothetical protein